MKIMRHAAAVAALAGAVAVPGTASAGFVWVESGPGGAGDVPATAQATYDSSFNTLDGIQGMLTSMVPVNGNPLYQVDLYKIRISDWAAFSATTDLAANGALDSALFLFDSSGSGVYMNDDTSAGMLATLPAGDAAGPVANGIYYLAVALGGTLALDGLSQAMFNGGNFTDVLGGNGNGPLAAWAAGFPSFDESPWSYSIALTGATNSDIPEPGGIALLLAGGIAAWLARRTVRRSEPVTA